MSNDDEGKTVPQGLPSTGRFKENEVGDPGVVGWAGMEVRERAEACLAAALARWPLDPERMYFNPGTGVVLVTRLRPVPGEPDKVDLDKVDVATRAVGDFGLARSKGYALLGAKWADVERACGLTQAKAADVLAKAFR